MNSYTTEQLAFINYEGDSSVILSATAGSGKTHSTVGKLNKMVEDGVDPRRIVFFSFTNDAVNELRSRIKHDVKITTIHSFTSSLLGKMKLFKPIVTFYDFVNWYKEAYKPKYNTPAKIKNEYYKNMDSFYEEGEAISSSFSAYKLQISDGIKSLKPPFYDLYCSFLSESKSRDFSDLLIDTEKLSRNPTYKKYFEGLYDYIFVDEYQDTSTLQMKILLAIKAKQYFLIGDRNQSIYGFSGANCHEIERLLIEKYPTLTMTLSTNFRSKKVIVEHANNYSDLKAVAKKEEDGYVHDKLLTKNELIAMIKEGQPLTMLARTNDVIKDIEMECLKSKVAMRYFNYITPNDIKKIKEGNIAISLRKKLDAVSPYYGGSNGLIKFIEDNSESEIFITSIHKSKGREFPRCVVINSIDPEEIETYKDSELYDLSMYSFIDERGKVDQEAKNVHYVAVTRPKDELYFMIYE